MSYMCEARQFATGSSFAAGYERIVGLPPRSRTLQEFVVDFKFEGMLGISTWTAVEPIDLGWLLRWVMLVDWFE